jgi:ABC-type Fe3+-hydroxamate transport system substrate-binding protein
VVDGSPTLGGTLNVSNLAGFGPGTYTLLTYGGTLSGSLALGSKPTGYTWALDTSVPGQVRLVVLARPPVFESIQAIGSDIVIAGSGPTNETYYMLSSTNLTVPMSQWTSITTNTFDGSGQFWFTNALDSSRPETFYRLRVP